MTKPGWITWCSARRGKSAKSISISGMGEYELGYRRSDDSGARTGLVYFALQGGGSHGAFTWGVLDRLLEKPWMRIQAISGTSAEAMNAAVLADGW